MVRATSRCSDTGNGLKQTVEPSSMAALTRLTLLTVILIINLNYCSLKQSTTNDAIELKQSKIPTEKAEEKHDSQIDNANTGESKLSSSVERQICTRNCSPEKESVKRSGRDVSNLQVRAKTKELKEIEKVRREKGGITHAERAVVLEAHNEVMNNLEYPAASMLYMLYNGQLEKVALLWTKQCDSTAEFPMLDFNDLQFNEGSLDLNFGANESYSWELILAQWSSGSKEFDIINSQCSNDSTQCERFVRMVWDETEYIGCASSFCPEYYREQERLTNIFSYACYYTPTGNTRPAGALGMQLYPYKRGESASECPPSHSYVWGNFCRTDPPCRDVRECKYPRDIINCLCNASSYESGQKSLVLCWKLLGFAVILFTVAFSSTNM